MTQNKDSSIRVLVYSDRLEGIPPPLDYEYFDRTRFAHDHYGFTVPQEDGSQKEPHYIQFRFDNSRRPHRAPSHTVSVRRRGQQGLDYGYPLHAKPLPTPPRPSLM